MEIHKILEELGLDRRNNVVFTMITDLENKKKAITYSEFLEIICNRLGDTKSRDGLEKIFALYDDDSAGYVDI